MVGKEGGKEFGRYDVFLCVVPIECFASLSQLPHTGGNKSIEYFVRVFNTRASRRKRARYFKLNGSVEVVRGGKKESDKFVLKKEYLHTLSPSLIVEAGY